jgi:peptidyl-prolyl cis-trans isomerase SurA
VIKIKKILILTVITLIYFSYANAEIKDGLFITVGNKAVTKSDIVQEMKLILILNNMSYSVEKKDELERMAIKSTIKRTIKEIEINKYKAFEYSKPELNNELAILANNVDMDVETLRNVCISNGLNFQNIVNQLITELQWNSFIFSMYKNRISVNLNEIDEQLKVSQRKKEFQEYLVSEIIFESIEAGQLDAKIIEIKNKIEIEGFEEVAMSLSISQSAARGGDLGWLSENEISKKFKKEIFNTPVGNISNPILLNEGILIFKVRDKRTVKNEITLEQLKDQLVISEKTKILNMYSLSHYDNLKRLISIKFYE